MSENTITNDVVRAAFDARTLSTKTDKELTEYLEVLCNTQNRDAMNQALATNRCVTINTVLTRRFMERVDKSTTRYTQIVIVLAAVSIIAPFVSFYIAPHGSPRLNEHGLITPREG